MSDALGSLWLIRDQGLYKEKRVKLWRTVASTPCPTGLTRDRLPDICRGAGRSVRLAGRRPERRDRLWLSGRRVAGRAGGGGAAAVEREEARRRGRRPHEASFYHRAMCMDFTCVINYLKKE